MASATATRYGLSRGLLGLEYDRINISDSDSVCVCIQRVITLLKKHGSAMHVAFLDASKAFDRVNRRKLLLKLESRGVPTYILRLLSNELIGQYIKLCVRWGSTLRIFPHWEWSEARGYIITLTF